MYTEVWEHTYELSFVLALKESYSLREDLWQKHILPTHNDGVQNMLPQSMASSRIEYFKQKELEQQHVLEQLSDLPLKQVIKPSWELSLYLEERSILAPKVKEHRNLNKR